MARPRSDIAPRILHAARERFLAEGVDGASLRAIAADAGTGIGMVYYYFPTKDDLFFAAVEETYAKVLAELEAAVRPDRPVKERIRRVYHRIAALSDEELLTLRLVIREALADNQRLERLIDRFQHGHIPLLLATVLEGLGDGTFRPAVPPVAAMMATLSIGAVPQIVRRFAGARLPSGLLPEGSAFADLLLEALFIGIGAKDSPKKAGAKPVPARKSRRTTKARRSGP